jgi:hypothetical protein
LRLNTTLLKKKDKPDIYIYSDEGIKKRLLHMYISNGSLLTSIRILARRNQKIILTTDQNFNQREVQAMQ